MSVLHPTLLAAGLAAIALPILIHLLLRRRYVPIRWAAMRFVMEAQKQQRRRRKLEQILLLIARCVLVALIAFAVARPLFGAPLQDRERTVVILIDNALASQSRDGNGETDLDRSKRLAIAEIDRLSIARGDRIAVFSAASPPTPIIGAPTGDLDTARDAINGIASTDSALDLAAAFELAGSMLREETNDERADIEPGATTFVALSAWRSGSLARRGTGDGTPRDSTGIEPGAATDGPGLSRPGASDVVLSSPAEDARANLRILEITIPRGVLLVDDTPAVRQAIVRIDRTGPADRDARATLRCGIRPSGGPPTQAEPIGIRFPAGQREMTVAVGLPIPSVGDDPANNTALVTISIEAGPEIDSIPGDSTRIVPVRVAQAVEVALVRSRGIRDDGTGIPPESWVNAALAPDDSSPVRVTEVAHSGLDPTALIGMDAVVVARPDLLTGVGWSALRTFVDQGGTIQIFTPSLEGAHAWVDDAAARFPILEGLAREAVTLDGPEPVVIGQAGRMLGLLGAELEDLAGAVRVSRILPIQTDPSRVVLQTGSGVPLLSQPAERVWFVSTAISPEWSDLVARPVFPAIMQEIARTTPTRGLGLSAVAGVPVSLPPSVARLEPEESIGRLPDQSRDGVWKEGLTVGGVYSVRGDADEPLGILAVNAHAESGDTATGSRSATEAMFADLGNGLHEGPHNGTIRWMDDGADQPTPEVSGYSDTTIAIWLFTAAVMIAVLESLLAARTTVRRAKPIPGSRSSSGSGTARETTPPTAVRGGQGGAAA